MTARLRSSRLEPTADPATGRRWIGVLALCVAVAAGHFPSACAAQVIGVVKAADDFPPFEEALKAFEGASGVKPIVESLATDKARWAKVQESLAKKSPNVIVPIGHLALEQASKAGLSAPLVFVMVTSPEKSVAAGAKNVAGVVWRLEVEPQLRKVKELLPKAKKIGVLYDPKNSADEIAAAQRAASGLGLEVVPRSMSAVTELAAALKELLDKKIDVLWMVADTTVTPAGNQEAFAYISEATVKAGVPIVSYAPKLTEAGALFSLAPDYADMGAQAGEMAKQVANGTAADSIGFKRARKGVLSVNLKVASTLGITLPAEAAKAPQVFK